MIDHLSLGVADVARAAAFYDAVLAPLGYVAIFRKARAVGYGLAGAKDETFAILAAIPPATGSRAGSHLAFTAPTRAAVDAFHAAARAMGAIDEGAPGLRPEDPYGPGYYAAFARDLDGHRIEAVCREGVEPTGRAEPVERPARPPFIVSTADVPETVHRYPRSDEPMAPSRAIGRAAGLLRIGLHVQRVPPGQRISWPHAEEDEEEVVYVLEGEIDAWIDGVLHRMRAGDLAAFPAGTGISHTFLNDGPREATLLVGGEAGKADSRIVYPMNPERRRDMSWSRWWDDAPARPLGPHDGKPEAVRAREREGR